MPLWVLYVVPSLIGVGVFVTGVLIDGGEFQPLNWFGYVGLGLVEVTLFVLGIGGLIYQVREFTPESTTPLSRVGERVLFSLLFLFLLSFGLLVGFLHHTSLFQLVYVQSFWVFSAVAAGLITFGGLLAVRIRRAVAGRVVAALAITLLVFGVWQHGLWLSWRESIRFGWADNRAMVRDGDDDAKLAERLHWAERMIDLRPEDPRGYVRRYELRRIPYLTDGLADGERAVELGSEDYIFRETLAEDYTRMGFFRDAIREYQTVLQLRRGRGGVVADTLTELKLARVQLDAGDFDAVQEWHARSKARGEDSVRMRDLFAWVQIGRGEYQEAKRTLTAQPPVTGLQNRYVLAWLLATCPDPTVRNGSEALALITTDLRTADERVREDSKTWIIPSGERVDKRKKELVEGQMQQAQPVLAAALAEVGRIEEARTTLDQWKQDVHWDKARHHKGFLAKRFARLDACLRDGKPYRDESEK